MFLNYIHRFRGVAITFIVICHGIRLLNWENSPLTKKICASITFNGAVLFVFIAGFLFQHLYSKYNYRKYLVNKFKNIIVPYLITSIPIILFYVLKNKGHWAYPDLNKETFWYQIIWYYTTGQHFVQFWFIPVITVFYFLFPIFRLIDENPKVYFFLLPISIIITAFIHRPPAESNILQMVIHLFS